MHAYGVREVERLLGLPRSTIRALVAAGFVSPSRGPRRAWRFSFQDLIVLRTAQALVAAKVPPKRITRAVRELRRRLPAAMPLSGLSIAALGERVVVREGRARWQAESGQYLLAFEGDPAEGALKVIEQRAAPGAQEWFDRGAALETPDAEAAMQAYRKALELDPACRGASVNLGLLLHGRGDLAGAERVYRDGLEACSGEPLLQYNLGVLLEDMERKDEALQAYREALRRDPAMADCHYNLALLCEALDKPRDAIRHMSHYRRLTGKKGGSS